MLLFQVQTKKMFKTSHKFDVFIAHYSGVIAPICLLVKRDLTIIIITNCIRTGRCRLFQCAGIKFLPTWINS